MSLWEFNACARAYNQMRETDGRDSLISNWRTANWTGAAFAGKLKPLRSFLGEDKVSAPKLTPEQIARLDRRFEERRVSGEP